jgi:hypothetical protein
MRTITIAILLSLTILYAATGQTKNPYLDLTFDKVLFYDFEIKGEKGSLIVDGNGKHLQTIVKEVQLDSSTIKKFHGKLGDKGSFGKVTAFCFDPHCGFVYYLKGKPVAQILICLECNGLRSSIEIPAQKQGKQGQGEDAYYILNGLSKSFRKHINDLLKRYDFSHQIEPGSTFDQ